MENKSQIIYREKREKAAASKERHIAKLSETVYNGRMYLALTEQAAWKHLLSEYLEGEMDPNKFIEMIYAKPEEIREAAVKMQALWEMMAHIRQKVRDGEKAVIELNRLGVRDSE